MLVKGFKFDKSSVQTVCGKKKEREREDMEVEKRIIVNGSMKLPIGYRFHPTEQELILHYLLPKAFASPLPSSIIPVFDVFFSHPLTFPGDQKEKQRYFFCKRRREMTSNEQRIKISSGDGYWKPIGKEKQIIVASGKTIGIRRTLAFYETNKSSSSSSSHNKTRWNMTEYCLAGFSSTKMFGEWMVYNVYEKKERKGRKQRKSIVRNDEEDFVIESDNETGPPPPSPPTSADESGSII